MIEERESKKIHRRTSLTSTSPPLKKNKKNLLNRTGGPGTRGAAVAFGAGFGLGSAYADGRKEVKQLSLICFLAPFCSFCFLSHLRALFAHPRTLSSFLPEINNQPQPAPRRVPGVAKQGRVEFPNSV